MEERRVANKGEMSWLFEGPEGGEPERANVWVFSAGGARWEALETQDALQRTPHKPVPVDM